MAITASGLSCAESYLKASPELRDAICNGCGPAAAKFDFVPDSMYGLSISEVCDIHDWDYHEGKTIEDKQLADRRMHNNLLRRINFEPSNFLIRWLRQRRAKLYYLAVKWRGGPAYWEGKE